MTPRHLTDYLDASALQHSSRPAVVDPIGRSITYEDLHRQSTALGQFLAAQGIKRGDRVGMVLPKSIEAVVSIFGILKAGAAYVPVDCTAPAERGRRILDDCRIRALIVDSRSLDVIPEDAESDSDQMSIVVVRPGAKPATRHPWTAFDVALKSGGASVDIQREPADLAYILYTSGSTGMPKGVMLTHDNAVSFIEWCSSTFQPSEQDRFSSHAPLHFDLSILDIYLAIKHGGTVYLIPDELGKSPKDLVRFIAANRLTIWYSTPSILMLLEQFAGAQMADTPAPRIVLFAGEVFPVKHLRALQRRWPSAAYYNLYGPTETNVCTFARIPERVPDERDTPYPIGFACSHCRTLVLDEKGQEVTPGDEGLLYISGPSVFAGYWNRPSENGRAFIERHGERWYNTGDLVRWNSSDGFLYVGRNDRMVKRRGYRIELGEIERALYAHPHLREVAVVSVTGDAGVTIVAFLACHQGKAPSIVELKGFCRTKLPPYMSPDRFVFQDRLSRTSTDKVDYQALTGKLLDSNVG